MELVIFCVVGVVLFVFGVFLFSFIMIGGGVFFGVFFVFWCIDLFFLVVKEE